MSFLYFLPENDTLDQGSQAHLEVRAALQDISPSASHTVFRDDKMQ